MKLKDEYNKLLERMRLPENSKKYNELVNSSSTRDKEDNLIYWEMDQKIKNLLGQISNEDDAENRFLIADCEASINKVKQLLDMKEWV